MKWSFCRHWHITSDWWFGTWLLWLSIQLNYVISQVTNSIIFQGRLKPPTRSSSSTPEKKHKRNTWSNRQVDVDIIHFHPTFFIQLSPPFTLTLILRYCLVEVGQQNWAPTDSTKKKSMIMFTSTELCTNQFPKIYYLSKHPASLPPTSGADADWFSVPAATFPHQAKKEQRKKDPPK